MNHRNKPERRTFLQDRFDILIKRQKNGTATFSELTELDDMINRDPELREKVIRENILMEETDDFNQPFYDPANDDILLSNPAAKKNLLSAFKKFLSRIFILKINAVQAAIAARRENPAIVL